MSGQHTAFSGKNYAFISAKKTGGATFWVILSKTHLVALETACPKHRNHRSYARSSMFEKRIFFQLISTLFCELKRGFVCTYVDR
jgi:hypothetical protein